MQGSPVATAMSPHGRAPRAGVSRRLSAGAVLVAGLLLCGDRGAAQDATPPSWWADIRIPELTSDTWDGAVAELAAALAEPEPPASWLVAGPFRLDERAASEPVLPGIDRLTEGGGVRCGGAVRRFAALRADPAGNVRLNHLLKAGNVAFAGADVMAASDGGARLFLSGRTAVSVWVNGRLASPKEGPALYLHREPDGDVLDIRLRKGANAILLKLTAVSRRDWWFSARVGRYPRHRLRIKTSVTLADRLGASHPSQAARALIGAAQALARPPENEPAFAAALLRRVTARAAADAAARSVARQALIALYRRAGAWRQAADLIEEDVTAEGAVAGPAARGRLYSADTARLMFLLGDLRLRAGQADRAVAVYEQLVGRYPSGAYAVDALLRIADLYRQAGLRERAEPVAEAALALIDSAAGAADPRRSSAEAVLSWSRARWLDRPNVDRDFEAERLLREASELAGRADDGPDHDPRVVASAVGLLQQAIDRGRTAVVSAGDGRFVGARAAALDALGDLLGRQTPAARRRLYDQAIGAEARELLVQTEGAGRADRDRRLRSLAGRFAMTAAAETAVDRLGNDALAAGRCGEAALCFGRLLSGQRRRWERSRRLPVWTAKAAFCAARRDPADASWLRLLAVSPEIATVSLDGRRFTVRADPRRGAPARWFAVSVPPSAAGRAWPTFGGDAGRAGWMEGRRKLPRDAVSVPFADSTRAQVSRSQRWPNARSGPYGLRLAHFAVVASDGGETRAFFHTDRMVYAIGLETGVPAWRFGAWWGASPFGRAERPWGPAGTFFTTVAEGRVYVRLRAPSRWVGQDPGWALYAVSAATGRLVWSTEDRRLVPPEEDEDVAAAEALVSEPAYAHGCVHAVVRSDEAFPRHVLVALRADTGEMIWRSLLASGPGGLRVFGQWPRNVYDVADACPPPTVAGDTVIVTPNIGLVFAVDALTGATRWVLPYERSFVATGASGRMRELVNRDLQPAVVRGDCVVAAPRDCQAVYGIDLKTGRRRWQRDLHGASRVLGCDAGSVYLDGRDLIGVSLADGTVRWRTGRAEPAVGAGLLVGKRLLVPRPGRLVRRSTFRDRVDGVTAWPGTVGPIGNLTLCGTHLIGFGRDGLTVFRHDPPPAFLERATARADLVAAERLAAEAGAKADQWAEADRRAAAAARVPDGDVRVRAGLVRAEAAVARHQAGGAASLVRRLLKDHGDRLVRTDDGWASVAALAEDRLPAVAGAAGPAKRRTGGLDLAAWASSREPVVLAVGGNAQRFVTVAGRWVACRDLAEPNRIRWRAQLPFEPKRVTADAPSGVVHTLLLVSNWEIAAVRASSGRGLWQWRAADRWPITTVRSDGAWAAVQTHARLTVLESAAGRAAWSEAIVSRGVRLAGICDGRVFVVAGGGERATLRAFDAADGERLWEVDVGPKDLNIVSCQDGRRLWLASGVARAVLEIDLASGREQGRAGLPAAWGKGIYYDLRRDGPLLTALFNRGSTSPRREQFYRQVFRVDPLTPVAQEKGRTDIVAVTGTTAAVGDAYAVTVWDLATGREIGTVKAVRPEFLAAATVRPAGGGASGAVSLEAILGEQPTGRGREGDARLIRRRRYRIGKDAVAVVETQVLAGVSASATRARLGVAAAWAGDRLVYGAADGVYVYGPSGSGGSPMPAPGPKASAVDAVGLARVAAERDAPALRCLPAKAAVHLDGRLDEWPAEGAVTLGAARHRRRPRVVQPEDAMSGGSGADDLSARVWAMYDAERLYLALDVRDQTHRPAGEGAWLWRGDGVEVALRAGAGRPSLPDPETALLALACRGGRPVMRWVLGGRARGEARLAVRRRVGGVVYELAIPWSRLTSSGAPPAAREGEAAAGLGLGVLVSDDDGAGLRGGLEFGAGISAGVAPRFLGRLVIVAGAGS